jgi:hypothetical protein
VTTKARAKNLAYASVVNSTGQRETLHEGGAPVARVVWGRPAHSLPGNGRRPPFMPWRQSRIDEKYRRPMLRRLLLGLCEGLVIGLVIGVACARGLGLSSPGSVVAAALSALAGFAVGLIAGRPIWAHHAKTEALLKAAAGALGGFGLSFALRHWLKMEVDLSAWSLGAGPAGQLSATTLPVVTTVLALFFELDDDGKSSGEARAKRAGKQRVDPERSGATPSDDAEAFDDEVEHQVEKR